MKLQAGLLAALQMQPATALFAQQGGDAGVMAGVMAGIFCYVIFLVGIYVLMAFSFMKLFEKAGKPGWAGWVPIYNIIVMLEVIQKPVWWIIMFFIPCVNIVFIILFWIEVAKAYGKDAGFAVGLILLGIIFLPILAFGDSRYVYGRGGGPGRPRRREYDDDYE